MKAAGKNLFILLIILGTIPGCAKRAPDPWTLNMLQSTSDHALLTMVVRQDRWQQARKTLAALAKLDPSGQLARISDSKDMNSALSVLLEPKPGAKNQQKLDHIEGLDPKKPIVAALFQPVPGDVALAARSMLLPSMKQIKSSGIPGIRHTVLLSATKVKTLMKDLRDFMIHMGFDELDKGQDKDSGSLFFQLKQNSFVALIPEKNRVRIEIVQDEILPDPGAQKRISSLLQHMAEPHPKSKSKFNSPAWRMTLDGKHLAAIHIRPWILRELSPQVGASQIAAALAYADPSQKAMLLAMGMSEVANGFLLMSRHNAEIEDVAMGLDLAGGLRITYVAGLTEYGEKIYKAGETKTPFDLMPKDKKAILAAWNRMDLSSIINSAKPLEAFSKAKNLNEARQAIMEGGFFVYLHFLLTSPVGISRTIMDLAPGDFSKKIPKGFTFVINALTPGVQDGIKASASLGFADGADTSWIKSGLMATGLGEKIQFSTDSEKDGVLVRMAMGMDAGKAFSSGKYSKNELAGASIDLQRLMNLHAFGIGAGKSLFERFDTLETKAWMKDRTFMAELLLPLAENKQSSTKTKWSDMALYGGSDWSSLAPSDKQSKGQQCMKQITRHMVKAFGAVAYAAPDQKGRLLAKSISELDAPLKCAMEQADTKAQAIKTRAVLVIYAADLMEENSDRQAALAILSKACKQGVEAACDHAEKLAAKPEPHPAKVTAETAPKLGILGTKSNTGISGVLGVHGSGGLAGTGIERQKQAAKPVSNKLIVIGSLPIEVIRRVMRTHINEFSYCYQRELLRNPKLSGKIMIKFTINEKGSINTAKVSHSTMNNKSVESCLTNKIKRIKFPQPKGGGIVIVNYPFIFKSN